MYSRVRNRNWGGGKRGKQVGEYKLSSLPQPEMLCFLNPFYTLGFHVWF